MMVGGGFVGPKKKRVWRAPIIYMMCMWHHSSTPEGTAHNEGLWRDVSNLFRTFAMLSRIKSCHDRWRRESCCRRSLVVPQTRLTSTSALPKRRRRRHTSHHHPPIYMANIYKCEEGTIKHILWFTTSQTCAYFGNLCELGMGFPAAPEPLAVYYKRLYFFI